MSDIATANTLQDISIVEGLEDSDIDEQLAAWQRLVDTGLAWKLQGWYGRAAIQLIEQGLIKRRDSPTS